MRYNPDNAAQQGRHRCDTASRQSTAPATERAVPPISGPTSPTTCRRRSLFAVRGALAVVTLAVLLGGAATGFVLTGRTTVVAPPAHVAVSPMVMPILPAVPPPSPLAAPPLVTTTTTPAKAEPKPITKPTTSDPSTSKSATKPSTTEPMTKRAGDGCGAYEHNSGGYCSPDTGVLDTNGNPDPAKAEVPGNLRS